MDSKKFVNRNRYIVVGQNNNLYKLWDRRENKFIILDKNNIPDKTPKAITDRLEKHYYQIVAVEDYKKRILVKNVNYSYYVDEAFVLALIAMDRIDLKNIDYSSVVDVFNECTGTLKLVGIEKYGQVATGYRVCSTGGVMWKLSKEEFAFMCGLGRISNCTVNIVPCKGTVSFAGVNCSLKDIGDIGRIQCGECDASNVVGVEWKAHTKSIKRKNKTIKIYSEPYTYVERTLRTLRLNGAWFVVEKKTFGFMLGIGAVELGKWSIENFEVNTAIVNSGKTFVVKALRCLDDRTVYYLADENGKQYEATLETVGYLLSKNRIANVEHMEPVKIGSHGIRELIVTFRY